MPTGEIAPQQAHLVSGNEVKTDSNTPPSMSPVNPAASDKTNYYGIEVFDKLVWKGWEAGKEYIKNLVLKNLSVKTLKLTYRVPESRFFSTIYPKPIFLSAGSSFTLPVTFRPLEDILYTDKIVFTLKDGNEFEIPLNALLPRTEISIPIDLDFKMCAVKDHVSITFDVYNIGDVDTPLQWDVNEPFTIEPAEAEVAHRSSVKFRATFRPSAAFVYEAIAVCKFGKELELASPTTFYGVGKFPHLLVSHSGKKALTANSDKMNNVETEVNFGKVAVASSSGQWVELHNLAPVRTPFRVERIIGMSRMDTAFHCTQTQGVVPPMSLMRIPLTYTPVAVDTTSIDYFSVVSVGDISRSIVKCVGTSIGPKVELGSYSLNFKQIDLGCSGTKTLDIINNSDVEAVYQFELDCDESVFKFPATSGTIKAHTTETIILKFVPEHPINYYRRVTCLVHNQSPLYLDLIGTCHSETVKPAILRGQHISRYLTHVERGLSVVAPEQLNELVKADRLGLDKNGCLEVLKEEDKASISTNPSPRDIPAIDEYFNDGFHSDVVNIVPHVSLDVNVLDFGNVHNLRMPEERTVNITNHTKGKVTVQWNGDANHVFSVSPDTLDIPPLKACSFRVTFRPTASNKIYGNELECFVYYKSMRDYRLVEDLTMCPPWCLTVKCLAHTFMPNNDTFLPRTAIMPPVVVFPAVNAGESTYRSILVGNTGETPIMYDLTQSLACPNRSKCGTKEDQKHVFAVKPNKGVLKCGYQVFTVRMTPNVVSSFSHDLLLRLNDNEKYDQMVHLSGSAESAEVLLDGEGNMYFKPTCVGTMSSRTYGFKNVSRIPLRFQWKVSKTDQKVLRVEPESGVIQPNQSLTQTWYFIPAEQKKYVIKPTLLSWGQGLSATSSGGKKRYFSLRVVGEGSLGDLQTDNSYLDFGDIVVGSSTSRQINLFNNGNCSLIYRLLIEGQDEAGEAIQSGRTNSADRPGVEFDSMEGVLPARGKHSITATIRPVKRVSYQYTVSYQLVTPHCEVAHPAVHEPQHLMHLLATGVYPSMIVSDIRSLGSAIGISKKALWNLFSLDKLNAYLDSDPSSDEVAYNIVTRHSTRGRTVMTKAILDFNFSAAPLGSEPCTISIMFDNHGTVPCEWAFMFPKDIQMEMGHWTESGDCDEDELHDMKVMDNKLFEITPKQGLLQPGEAITVTFSYHHTMAGTDRIPVLMKIARGREVMLNFIGVTVDPILPYIHFPSNKHSFNPVPVGEKISPKQVYELYNGGAVPVTYECDLTPLEIIKQENFDQPIFECLNPSGEILPGRAMPIEWRFFPLEAKTYMVDIPIKVHNGDTAIVTFTGIGYDKRVMGDTMPFSDQPDMCGVPSVQAAELPGQLGYLSMERISFGNMPLFSQARRLVFITNKSKERSIFFQWHVTSQADSQFLNIYPVRGQIGPNEYKMCRVTFQATNVPSFYDLDLVCEVHDLHEFTQYKKQLAAWEAERDRQMDEFTVNEKDPHADMRTPRVVEIVDGPPSGRLSKLDALCEGRPISADGELSKYKTLPPIRALTWDEKREMARKRQEKLKQLWIKPQLQKPFLLHLGVTARTHDTRHFQSNFPDEYCHFYIDRTLSERREQHQETELKLHLRGQKDKERAVLEPPTHLACSIGEASIVGSVMGNCLRGLLDDTYFIQAVKKVMQEPIPYYVQIAGKRLPSGPMSSTPRMAASSGIINSPRIEEVPAHGEEAEAARPVTAGDIEMDLHGDSESVKDGDIAASSSTYFSSNFRGPSELEMDRLQEEAELLKEKQIIKKLPEFGNSAEQILENTVLNLMFEALSSEYSVVSKPRFIAMPRRKTSVVSKDSAH